LSYVITFARTGQGSVNLIYLCQAGLGNFLSGIEEYQQLENSGQSPSNRIAEKKDDFCMPGRKNCEKPDNSEKTGTN
jgi:hypothetical protein